MRPARRTGVWPIRLVDEIGYYFGIRIAGYAACINAHVSGCPNVKIEERERPRRKASLSTSGLRLNLRATTVGSTRPPRDDDPGLENNRRNRPKRSSVLA